MDFPREKLGIIAGSRLLPVLLARKLKENKNQVVIVCFKGETLPFIRNYADKIYWIEAGHLGELRRIIKKESLSGWIMAGQISPLRIFKRNRWDDELTLLAGKIKDFRPHNIFLEIIRYLESEGVKFLDSTQYLKDSLADEGVMNGPAETDEFQRDIDFGVEIISRFVDLDVGQTIVVKERSVVALESLEGTNNAILRGARLAGCGCTVLKFSKSNQDLRFDVPVVGVSTLKLLRKVKAGACVLENKKVIILEKPKFLCLARKWRIPIIGKDKLNE